MPLPAAAPLLALGAAGGATAGLFLFRAGVMGQLGLIRANVPATGTGGHVRQDYEEAARHTEGRLSRVRRSLGRLMKDVAKDLAEDYIKDAVTFPAAAYLINDSVYYWLINDLAVKQSFNKALNFPTRASFIMATVATMNTILAMVLTDLIANRDIGSDLAESVIEGFSQNVLGDVIKEYLNTVAGIESIDDDEIRDVVGEGVASDPEELAYVAARSGLDNYSSLAEVYTGLIQGDSSYLSRLSREVDDLAKRAERADYAHAMFTLAEKITEDLADSAYWVLSALDPIEAAVRDVIRDLADLAAYPDENIADFLARASNELDELERYVEVVGQEAAALMSSILDSYENMTDVVREYVKARIDELVGRVRDRIKDHEEKTKQAYTHLRRIRNVVVS